MGAFQLFKIVQMVPSRAKRHIKAILTLNGSTTRYQSLFCKKVYHGAHHGI